MRNVDVMLALCFGALGFGALSLGVLGAGTVAPVEASPRAAIAISSELDEARALIEQARPHVDLAMNPDNKSSDRKKGRKAAYKLLKKARGLFDAYLDANPGQTESLDEEYCALSTNLYWIKKFATLNEFRGDDDDRVVELPPAKAGDDGGASGKGGIGGATRKDEPTPSEDDPDPDPGDEPPAEDVPAAPPARDPAEERADEARAVFDALQEEEARRPGDVAHLHALYEKFLVEYDDPALRVYQRAALRLGALNDQMNNALKEQTGFDPDAFDAKDSTEVTRVVKSLTDMLRNGEPEERQRAAEMLGRLATSAAGYPLAKVLFDKDEVVAKYAADGLVVIGGKRAATNLTKLYRDAKVQQQFGALDVLTRICAKGDVDARSASFALGRFVLSKKDPVADAALESLVGLGSAGVPGLLEALSTKSTQKRVGVIRALGDTGHVEATPRIAMYLLAGSKDRTVSQRSAAKYAIGKFGLAAVPYLIPILKDTKRKITVREVLVSLTGQYFPASRPGDWQRWWKREGAKQLEDG